MTRRSLFRLLTFQIPGRPTTPADTPSAIVVTQGKIQPTGFSVLAAPALGAPLKDIGIDDATMLLLPPDAQVGYFRIGVRMPQFFEIIELTSADGAVKQYAVRADQTIVQSK